MSARERRRLFILVRGRRRNGHIRRFRNRRDDVSAGIGVARMGGRCFRRIGIRFRGHIGGGYRRILRSQGKRRTQGVA